MQITCNTSSVYHAQCHVMCHVVRRDSSAIKFDRIEIAFVVALFYWLNYYSDEGLQWGLWLQLCQGLGFICEVCQGTEVIFPFQLNDVAVCPGQWEACKLQDVMSLVVTCIKM